MQSWVKTARAIKAHCKTTNFHVVPQAGKVTILRGWGLRCTPNTRKGKKKRAHVSHDLMQPVRISAAAPPAPGGAGWRGSEPVRASLTCREWLNWAGLGKKIPGKQ